MPIGAMSAAMAEAVPPLEPPTLTLRFTGLRVNPKILFVVLRSVANSGVLVLPSRMAPAFFRRSTETASSAGT